MTSDAQLAFFKVSYSVRDKCRESFKKQENFNHLFLFFIWMFCKFCVALFLCLSDCLHTSFLFPSPPSSFNMLPISSQSATRYSLHLSFPKIFYMVLLTLVFLSWKNTCTIRLASWNSIFLFKLSTGTLSSFL